MKAVKVILIVLGVVTVFLGLVFIIGGRPLTGPVILGTGILLLVFGLRSRSTRSVVLRRELELTGDVRLEDMKCRQCGGSLSSENISLKAGTVFVSCPYCHSEYQIEEAPKW
jgi:hypothetical protein